MKNKFQLAAAVEDVMIKKTIKQPFKQPMDFSDIVGDEDDDGSFIF